MSRVNPFFSAEPDRYSLTTEHYLHYELEYYIFKNSSAPSICVWDTRLDTYNSIGLVFYMINVANIQEDILETIDEVISRKWGDEIIGNNYTLTSVIVDPEMSLVTFDKDQNSRERALSDSSLQMETKDFQAITKMWLEFLESMDK